MQISKPLTLAQIVASLQSTHGIPATLAGDNAASVVVSGVATLEAASNSDISFLANKKYRKQVAISSAGALVLAPADASIDPRARIVTANPYAYFAHIVGLLRPKQSAALGIHVTAVIAPSAQVSPSASIGAYAVIEADAVIEEHAVIGPHCVIGAGSRVGKYSRLMPRVTIYAGCTIGANVTLHSGVVVGADGFGFAPDFKGEGASGGWLKVPQIGGVRIGDHCEIGANTTIDRGALSDTVIGKGCIIDNQIQIAHNCVIGDFTAIAGCVGLAGSTVIGQRCLIGGAAMLTGHLEVPDGTTILAGAFISKSITKPGVYSSSFPASEQIDWLKTVAQVRQLEVLAQRVKRLEALHSQDESQQQ